MPNNQGLYFLSDIQDRVRRLLDAVSFNVNSTTGAESNLVIQDQQISNTEITNNVNEALTDLYAEMMEGRDSLFATTSFISTQGGFVGPYFFPTNMLDLRYMKWNLYQNGSNNAPYGVQNVAPSNSSNPYPGNLYGFPNHWYPMVMIDDPADVNSQHDYRAPTWRWENGSFILNWVPQYSNPNGIMVNYTAMAPELVNATDTILIPRPQQFIRFVQQAVIYDTAVSLAASKGRNVSEQIAAKKEMWHARTLLAVTNAYRSESVQMTAPQRMMRMTFSGRRQRRWNYE